MNSSIFTIERRISFSKEFEKISFDLTNTFVKPSSGLQMSLYHYLDYCLKYWPFRCGSLSISSYINSIKFSNNSENSDKYKLLYCELYINLLHYAPEKERQDFKCDLVLDTFGQTQIAKESERIIQNIEYMLEQSCNMYVRVNKSGNYPKYIISKRDADVDATLESAPNINEFLLGYLDVRNEDDLDYKKNVLIAIHNFLEPQRYYYKNIYSGIISEAFFAAMNKLNIRHNNEKQIVLPENNQRSIYDKLFKMGLFVIRSKELLEYKQELETIYKEEK